MHSKQTLLDNLGRLHEASQNPGQAWRRRHPLFDRLLGELVEARIASGLTQGGVAARLGTTQSAVSRLEQRHGGVPTLRTLERSAFAVGRRVEIRIK